MILLPHFLFSTLYSSANPWYSLPLSTTWYSSPTDLINFPLPGREQGTLYTPTAYLGHEGGEVVLQVRVLSEWDGVLLDPGQLVPLVHHEDVALMAGVLVWIYIILPPALPPREFPLALSPPFFSFPSLSSSNPSFLTLFPFFLGGGLLPIFSLYHHIFAPTPGVKWIIHTLTWWLLDWMEK